jgi:hypothetical protein
VKRDTSLVTLVFYRPLARLTPFLQYPLTGCPFFFLHLTFPLLLQHKTLYHQNSHIPRSYPLTPSVLSLCELIHQVILFHALPFFLKYNIDFTLVLSEILVLGLKFLF